eukprot:6772840-Ditylum_brightwellii.AAC.1
MATIKKDHTEIDWTTYQPLIKQQTKIRWEQIKYGRFRTAWTKAQGKYIATMHQTSELNPY